MLDAYQKRIKRVDLKLNNITINDLRINDIYFNSSLKDNIVTSKNGDLIWRVNYAKYMNNTNMIYGAVGVYQEKKNKYSANIILARSTGVFNTVKNMFYATSPYHSIIPITDTVLRAYYFVYPERYKELYNGTIHDIITKLKKYNINVNVAKEQPVTLTYCITEDIYMYYILPFSLEQNSTINIYMICDTKSGKNCTVGTNMPINGDIIKATHNIFKATLNMLQSKDCNVANKGDAVMKIMAILANL